MPARRDLPIGAAVMYAGLRWIVWCPAPERGHYWVYRREPDENGETVQWQIVDSAHVRDPRTDNRRMT